MHIGHVYYLCSWMRAIPPASEMAFSAATASFLVLNCKEAGSDSSFLIASTTLILQAVLTALTTQGFVFVLEDIGVNDDHLSGVVLVAVIRQAVGRIEQAKGLPGIPHLFYKQIGQSGMGFYREVPSDIIVGDIKLLCPPLIALGEPAVVGFLLHGIGKYPIDTGKSIAIQDAASTVPQAVITIVLGNCTLNGSGTVTVLPIAVTPLISLTMPKGFFPGVEIQRFMLLHGCRLSVPTTWQKDDTEPRTAAHRTGC